MVVLGLLLVVASVAALVVVFADETSTATMSITFMDNVYELTQLQVFLAGAAAAAAFMIGLMMMKGSMRRTLVHRRDLRQTRKAARDRVTQLEQEKKELERKLDEAPQTVPADRGKHAGSSTPIPTPHTDPREPIPAADDQLVAGKRPNGTR